MPEHLSQQYDRLKAIASEDLRGTVVARLICDMTLSSREMLRRAERVQLTSRVVGKRYFGSRREEQSRPINATLYLEDERELHQSLRAFRRGFRTARAEDVVRTTYTIGTASLLPMTRTRSDGRPRRRFLKF